MLKDKLLGIFKALPEEGFTLTELSKLSCSKRNDVALALSLLEKGKKIVKEKNRYQLTP